MNQAYIDNVLDYFQRAKKYPQVTVYVNFYFAGHGEALKELGKRKIIIKHDIKFGRQYITTVYEYQKGLYEFHHSGDDESLSYIGKK